jgi:DNA-binding transcriptional activator of the SARP family
MMRFRLLGPVEVRAGEDWRGIGAPKWRSVLAALLIHPGQIVSADTLIGELWRDEPPARAANLVSIYVLRLRRLMDDPDGHLLVTRAPGYLLRVAGDDTDALLFEAMVRDGRRAFAAGDPEGAASRLTEALGLWYGRPWPTSRRRRWSRRRPNGSGNSASAPTNCGSRPNSPSAGTTRPSPSCAGSWPTIRSGRACGCC